MDLFEWALRVSKKRLRDSSLAVYRSMWGGYRQRLGATDARWGPTEPGAESAEQMLAALEGAGDYSARKRVFGLVRWTYDTLQESGMSLTNPCAAVEKLFMPDFRPEHEVLTPAWQDEMVAAARASCRGWKSVRLAAIVALLCESALKNSELIALKLDSLSGASSSYWLEAGRGVTQREFLLSEKTSKLLEEWLSVRPACESDLLFVADASGRAMDHATLWRQLKRVTLSVQGADNVRHFGTGLIRATKARELADGGAGVEQIAQFLGHRQTASTGELLERVHRRGRRRSVA